MRKKLAAERFVALKGLLKSRLEEIDEKPVFLTGQQASLQNQGEILPDGVHDSDQTHIQKATELRKTIADLVAAVASYEAVIQHNPRTTDIRGRLETARRDLMLHRDELATRIQLLELQRKDAERVAELAAKDQERLIKVNKAVPNTISPEILDKARRDLETAQLRVQRIGTLLELYRKTDSSDELPLQTFKPDDASAASPSVGIRPIPGPPEYRGGTSIPGGVVPLVPGSVISVRTLPDEFVCWELLTRSFTKLSMSWRVFHSTLPDCR